MEIALVCHCCSLIAGLGCGWFLVADTFAKSENVAVCSRNLCLLLDLSVRLQDKTGGPCQGFWHQPAVGLPADDLLCYHRGLGVEHHLGDELRPDSQLVAMLPLLFFFSLFYFLSNHLLSNFSSCRFFEFCSFTFYFNFFLLYYLSFSLPSPSLFVSFCSFLNSLLSLFYLSKFLLLWQGVSETVGSIIFSIKRQSNTSVSSTDITEARQHL